MHYDAITLRASYQYGVRLYQDNMRAIDRPATHPNTRYAGWREALNDLANRIARDVAAGRDTDPEEVALYRRVAERMHRLAARR